MGSMKIDPFSLYLYIYAFTADHLSFWHKGKCNLYFTMDYMILYYRNNILTYLRNILEKVIYRKGFEYIKGNINSEIYQWVNMKHIRY